MSACLSFNSLMLFMYGTIVHMVVMLFLDMTLPIEIWSCLTVYVLRIFFIYLMKLVHFSEETILHHLRRACLSRAYRWKALSPWSVGGEAISLWPFGVGLYHKLRPQIRVWFVQPSEGYSLLWLSSSGLLSWQLQFSWRLQLFLQLFFMTLWYLYLCSSWHNSFSLWKEGHKNMQSRQRGF